MNFQELISALDRFWSRRGCALLPSYDVEKTAGTFTPAVFFGALSPRPLSLAGVEICRRPGDARFGRNPARLGIHHQYQAVIKPPAGNLRQAYLESLKALGLRLEEHDIRWLAADLDLPLPGASGAGWEIRADGLSVSRFTYLSRMGGLELEPACVEIRYGLERLAMLVQRKKRIFDLMWDDRLTYGEVRGESERQFSDYNYLEADTDALRAELDANARGIRALLGKGLYLPAYDLLLKSARCSDLLASRRAFSGGERAELESGLRRAARACAAAYADSERTSRAAEKPAAAKGAAHE